MQAAYLKTNGDSIIDFPCSLELDNYGCGIIKLSGKIPDNLKSGDKKLKKKDSLYLCSDICQESIVNNIFLPVLIKIEKNNNGIISGNINHVTWLKLKRYSINNLRLYITDEEGDIVLLGDNYLYCTLLFIPLKKWQ